MEPKSRLARVFDKLMEYFSRKFILAPMALVGGFYLVMEDKDVTGFTGLVTAILGLYGGANVVQDFIQSKYSSDAPQPIENTIQGDAFVTVSSPSADSSVVETPDSPKKETI